MLKTSLSSHSCNIVISVLDDVLNKGALLDRAHSRHFSGEKLLSNELARITTVTGDIIRKFNYYSYLADVNASQIEREGSRLLNVWHQLHQLPLPDMAYSLKLDDKVLAERQAFIADNQMLIDGCPQWLDELGQAQLKTQWTKERAALSQAPKRYLRANLLKADRAALINKLASEGIEAIPVTGVETAVEVISDSALFRSAAFKEGWFEQQDAGSQHVADALDVKAGMRVIDACAGAGGKTLHLAAKMQGKGHLLALDVEQWKLDNLKSRARRANAHNVETRLIVSSKTIKRLKLSADRLLLDVPCSGLGVLKRNPDTKWRDTADRLPVLVALQADILQRYSKMLKIDGILVYATCSILPQENREQVDKFLANNPDFSLLDDHTISPAETGFDGFYLARIQRNKG